MKHSFPIPLHQKNWPNLTCLCWMLIICQINQQPQASHLPNLWLDLKPIQEVAANPELKFPGNLYNSFVPIFKRIHKINQTNPNSEDGPLERELSLLRIFENHEDVNALNALHATIEKIRRTGQLPQSYHRNKALLELAHAKLSPQMQDQYRDEYGSDQWMNGRYRWLNLSKFLYQQLFNFYAKEVNNSTESCRFCKKDGHSLDSCPSRKASLCYLCFQHAHSQNFCKRFGHQNWSSFYISTNRFPLFSKQLCIQNFAHLSTVSIVNNFNSIVVNCSTLADLSLCIRQTRNVARHLTVSAFFGA